MVRSRKSLLEKSEDDDEDEEDTNHSAEEYAKMVDVSSTATHQLFIA